ncbi:PIN domain-containing protein [Epidermidibacterium keratini]|uniref:PIN domain-containing protein n=1 Tax=Epidermidibacterium keratini TaxID=1891644 RepID=A0A7L4YLC2_9ACTN|nr:type II toxin-antitoxin system VapC family toxin [Epidermidibacterium keratini]QHC00075.1 PIN domain-containing protein [Epidermidibacterium keratini]
MIVDASAVLAVLQREDGWERIAQALLDAPSRMSVANWLEAAIVVDSRSGLDRDGFGNTIESMGIDLEPVTAEQAHVARSAYRRFGRGSGHPAKLNFGDCFAYALSVLSGEPLLYVGDDFAATDVEAALA